VGLPLISGSSNSSYSCTLCAQCAAALLLPPPASCIILVLYCSPTYNRSRGIALFYFLSYCCSAKFENRRTSCRNGKQNADLAIRTATPLKNYSMSNENLPDNKRPRLETAAAQVTLLDLPSFQQHILSFLDQPDRLKLAETCHCAKNQVDVYCGKVLERITGIDNCNVDETFHERIRDQSKIRTSRAQPVLLSSRYLLSVTLKREPLYKIRLDENTEMVYNVAKSPSNLIALDTGDDIDVYDLKSRKKMTTLSSQ